MILMTKESIVAVLEIEKVHRAAEMNEKTRNVHDIEAEATTGKAINMMIAENMTG